MCLSPDMQHTKKIINIFKNLVAKNSIRAFKMPENNSLQVISLFLRKNNSSNTNLYTWPSGVFTNLVLAEVKGFLQKLWLPTAWIITMALITDRDPRVVGNQVYRKLPSLNWAESPGGLPDI